MLCKLGVNCLPDDKTLDGTKLKQNVAKIIISVFDRIENIVDKGENADYQHFPLFPQCFQMPSPSGLLKFGIVW